MSIFLILPHQLFDISYLDKEKTYVLWEHPHYFTAYTFNKKKLVLHRASMRAYYDEMISAGYSVKYYEFHEQVKVEKYEMFDPIDKIKLKGEKEFLESPNFLLSKKQYLLYRKKTKSFRFTNFYMWSKKELSLYPELKSHDKANRQVYNDDVKIPGIKKNKTDQSYIAEAAVYVEKHFSKNYGSTENFIYPVTRKSAFKWLDDFLEKKLNDFGPYQDFVKKDEPYMFHSLLSSSINIGLINPIDIVERLKKIKSKVPINSFEGYLRQLFWREYQRYTYLYVNFNKKNYFGNRKRLTKSWYEGTLGFDPVDHLIKSGFETGYIHHIGRLMFIGNFMNLSGISPKQGFKWFMEFAIDSYEWVMYQNVLDMVFFVTGGKTMRKPYITSSAYILKMSDFKKGQWATKWDKMYRSFLIKHKQKLVKFRYYFSGLR